MQQNCVERSKANENFKRTNERTKENNKKNTQQRPSIHRTNQRQTTTATTAAAAAAATTIAMVIHWECVYDPIWEGNGALKHKIYTKSCAHSVRIFRFSCLDVPAADIFHRPTPFVWQSCGIWVPNACYAKSDIVHTVELYKWWCFSALEHSHIFVPI